MKVSINKNIINKNEKKANQSKNFESFDLTPEELAENISTGFAFSYQFSNAHRKADNFICSDIIAADFDSGMSLDEALNNPYFNENASILYTTPSHTEESNRFRIIFQLPRTIVDRDEIRAAQQGLTKMFPADKAAVDPARQFYGSKGCKPKLFNKILSAENLQILIELGREPLRQTDLDGEFRVAGTRSNLTLEQDILVETSRGEMKHLSELENSKPVYCPFHQDNNASAFTTISKSGSRGIHCSSCEQTFWQKDVPPEKYDFLEFDKLAHEKFNSGIGETYEDPSGIDFHVPNPNVVLSERFLHVDDIRIVDGITLIKSPKGSGKTEYLKRVVQHYRDKKLRVLLIGHRRSLLQALSASLGLDCYLDRMGWSSSSGRTASPNYAISVDSLATQLNPQFDKYDVVLVDESEQVLSHLISTLMDNEKRRKCYLLFQHYIKVAKNVVVLDADLNSITLHAIQRFGNANPLIDRRLVLNEYKAPASDIELFSSEKHLIGRMFDSLQAGERLFVACNSKTQVHELVKAIQFKFGNGFPLFAITADNSGHPDVIKFIKNIKHEILNFKILIVSPAMGTGIDITFPDEVSHVDGVYGIFHAKVNTHFEIDQQLARVRQPKYVRVWVSPEIFNFEYEVEPIKQELAESGGVPEAMTGYLNSGMPDYNWTEPYLILYATIISAQRASKNRLKENFISLRRYNGWNVVEVPKDKALAGEGSAFSKTGKELHWNQYVHDMMNAKIIDWKMANAIKDQKKMSSQPLSADDQNSFDRYWIESFYRGPVTPELLLMDNKGKYREQIKCLEGVLGRHASKQKSNKTDADREHDNLAKIFESSGLLDANGDWNTSLVLSQESLQPFVNYCMKNKTKIEQWVQINIRKDVFFKPVPQLAMFLKKCGLDTTLINVRTKNGKKIYEYELDSGMLKQATSIIEHRKLNRHDVDDVSEVLWHLPT